MFKKVVTQFVLGCAYGIGTVVACNLVEKAINKKKCTTVNAN